MENNIILVTKIVLHYAKYLYNFYVIMYINFYIIDLFVQKDTNI